MTFKTLSQLLDNISFEREDESEYTEDEENRIYQFIERCPIQFCMHGWSEEIYLEEKRRGPKIIQIRGEGSRVRSRINLENSRIRSYVKSQYVKIDEQDFISLMYEVNDPVYSAIEIWI